MFFDLTLTGINLIQSLVATGFEVGTGAEVNTDTVTYHYVAWKAVAGGDQSAVGGSARGAAA